MFLALDESFSNGFTTIGCLCLPIDKLREKEEKWIHNRISEKIWAELKWEKVCVNFLEKYKKFIVDYIEDDEITFHSWTYKTPSGNEVAKFYSGDSSKVFYCQAYLLLRSVIRKCLNGGYDNNFYIVVDETGKRGSQEYVKTKQMLIDDNNIRPRVIIEHCGQGNSSVCGALQISDICTGAVRYAYENRQTATSPSDEIKELLEKINKDIPLNYSPARLPKINEFKFHHCLYSTKTIVIS